MNLESTSPSKDKGKARAREDDPKTTWSDVALALGAELMRTCRVAVRQRLGYTCSAGVARNKVSLDVGMLILTKLISDSMQALAKLCSAWRKPNAQNGASKCGYTWLFAALAISEDTILGIFPPYSRPELALIIT